jgi:hypothetical protein
VILVGEFHRLGELNRIGRTLPGRIPGKGKMVELVLIGSDLLPNTEQKLLVIGACKPEFWISVPSECHWA